MDGEPTLKDFEEVRLLSPHWRRISESDSRDSYVAFSFFLLFQRFFGIVRTIGGNEDHATITNLTQIFRLLSLHAPQKIALRGNDCTGVARAACTQRDTDEREVSFS